MRKNLLLRRFDFGSGPEPASSQNAVQKNVLRGITHVGRPASPT